MDPRAAKSAWWGSPMAFAVGRNRHGDNRPPRDCVVRRTDGEELLSYEAWEVDRPWWTEAISAYPLQRVGVRFRPLVHTRFESNGTGDGQGENDLLPFLPPPIPPQPNGNPKTAPNPNPKTKKSRSPIPQEKPTPGPPPPGTGEHAEDRRLSRTNLGRTNLAGLANVGYVFPGPSPPINPSKAGLPCDVSSALPQSPSPPSPPRRRPTS